MNIVGKSLGERINIGKTFVYDYPQVLNTDSLRDIQVTDETTIDVVFIHDGASMKNMIGYYLYTIDENGDKKILDDSDEDEKQTYHYKPTIIFPYVKSIKNDNTTLQVGDTRRLRGNLPNGNFKDVYVGFYLVAHGWYANIMNSQLAEKYILYSTVDFAQKYKNTGYDIVDNKIYSVYVKGYSESGDEMLLVAFEDSVANGGGDLDYNDAVIGLQISNVNNIVDYDKYSKLVIKTPPQPKNNIIKIDDDGEYVEFDLSKYNILNDKDYLFERHFVFDNSSIRDSFYSAINNLLTNYNHSKITVDENGKFKVICKYLFRKNDIVSNRKKNTLKLYLFQTKFNTRKKLFDYERVVVKGSANNEYVERYRLYETVSLLELIKLTTIFDNPVKNKNESNQTDGNFRIIGDGIVDCINGRARIPFNLVSHYLIYKNVNYDSSGLVINIKMDTHPDNFMAGKKNFVTMIGFVVNNGTIKENIVIDLKNLNIYNYDANNNPVLRTNLTELNSEFKNISVSDIMIGDDTVKDLVAIFRNNSSASYRIVTINNSMKFYCIRFANVKNNPTMVFMNNENILNWTLKSNSKSGTYFVKQKSYPVDSIISY